MPGSVRIAPVPVATAADRHELLTALGMQSGGLVCLVGAGGKKSTMRAVASAWTGRVALTATAHMLPFPPGVVCETYAGEGDALLAAAAASRGRVVAFAGAQERHGRSAGVPASLPAALVRAGFPLCLVKADGARGRLLKAPAHYEPVIATATDCVLALVSIRSIGRPLDGRVAHRCERIEALTGLAPGAALAPTHVAQLLAHDDGLLRGSVGARALPIINMADDPRLTHLAREVAREALARSTRFDTVVIARMSAGVVVDTVHRSAPAGASVHCRTRPAG